MDKPTCKTCVYWNHDDDDEFNGDCRRHPPKIEEGFEFGFWPGTHSDDWCGEHQDFIKLMLDRNFAEVPLLTGGTALVPRKEAKPCRPLDSAGDPGTTSS